MRRVLAIFNGIGAGMSLVVCLTLTIVWVRSHYVSDGWARSWYIPGKQQLRYCWIGSAPGRAQIDFNRLRLDDGVVVMVREEGQNGDLYIANFGVMRYQPRWLPQNSSMDWPGIENWWEGSGVYVRWKDNQRAGLTPGTQANLLVIVPYWVLLLLFLIWPAIWGVPWWRRRRRMVQGRCVKCGYDLRESPERCPECGRENSALSV